jgi:hypothetical protein
MSASALLLAAVGFAFLFAPSEVQRLLAAPDAAAAPPLLLQLWSAALLGLAAMSWTGRGLTLGGIYGRALVLGNLVHWTVGALVAARAALAHPASTVPWAAVAVYGAFAPAFGRLLRRHPGPAPAAAA